VTRSVIQPGSVLGVLGGGQLGALFTRAASTHGYRVAVWDPDHDAPAHRVAAHSFTTPFADPETVGRFASTVAAVTYEWENVPAGLCEQLERQRPVRPSGSVLRSIQNRLVQKRFLSGHGLPVPRFAPLTDPTDLPDVIREIGCPAICKTAMAGYDGKGQWRIDEPSAVARILPAVQASAIPGMQWIVEAHVPFDRELSILVARGVDGQMITYPLVENEHEHGILRTTLVPAMVPSEVVERAEALARVVIERMDGVGLFCLELFLLQDAGVLINEVAPRPHNSGHYTLDACRPSQFDQQVRAVCGLPPEQVRLLSPAVMVNLIGKDIETVKQDVECRRLLEMPGVFFHDYGKRELRPRRKMGHVTFLAQDRGQAWERAEQLHRRLLHAIG
jgi:5-(carboxyamino)imidazole ribonucleotide synthase